MSFEHAMKVADAVLYEGYLLYPYRASAVKNQQRWQFGVLMPETYTAIDATEASEMYNEVLLEPLQATEVRLLLRFLHLERRCVERANGCGDFEPVASLTVDGREHFGWDEAESRELEISANLDDLLREPLRIEHHVPGSTRIETIAGASGEVAGRYVRRCEPLDVAVEVSAERVPAASPLMRLCLRVQDRTLVPDKPATRDLALPFATLGTHVLIMAEGGEFVSATDPPEWLRGAGSDCTQRNGWPVLAGSKGARDTLLIAPIILPDFPEISPESPGDLFDATEIDEILTLRTMNLTPAEKQEVLATDPRAAELLSRSDSLPPEVMDRLHGAIRYLRAVTGPATEERGIAQDTATSTALVREERVVAPDSRVRLHPAGTADAQDIFLEGRTAVVESVLQDVDGDVQVTVTLEDDPGADVLKQQGRFLYFRAHELEALGDES